LGLLVALVVLDELVERDPDLQQAMVLVNVGIRGAVGAVSAWGLEDALGDALPDPIVWLIGAGVAVGVHLLRARVQAHLPDAGEGWLNPRTWLGWLEVGGVVGLVTAVFLAPFVALAFVVLATVGGVVALLATRGIERARYRRVCPRCGFAARVEACRCPGCRGPLEVVRWIR
jgi:lipopolysaccharide biosynthesis regulator YciM